MPPPSIRQPLIRSRRSRSGGGPAPAPACLAQTICAVKERIRWQTPAWTPSQCRRIADAVDDSAKRHDISPTLAARGHGQRKRHERKVRARVQRDGKIYAKDGGLMAIRCMLDDKDRCTNGNVRGVAWKDLMDPVNEHRARRARARALARRRRRHAQRRSSSATATEHRYKVTKNVPCQHKTHAWWAHYNHGPRYIDKGYAASLPAPHRRAGSRVRDGDEHARPGAGQRAASRSTTPASANAPPIARWNRATRSLRADPLQRDLLGAGAELKGYRAGIERTWGIN